MAEAEDPVVPVVIAPLPWPDGRMSVAVALPDPVEYPEVPAPADCAKAAAGIARAIAAAAMVFSISFILKRIRTVAGGRTYRRLLGLIASVFSASPREPVPLLAIHRK